MSALWLPVLKVSGSFVPALVFLAALMALDGYKLVRFRAILLSLCVGGCAALVAYVANAWLFRSAVAPSWIIGRWLAPAIEETLKAVFVYYLIRSDRTGFLVDSGIHGFAVGTGFALAENAYYLVQDIEVPAYGWLVRGFGTAVMHGGTTAIFGIVSRKRTDEQRAGSFRVGWPGWTGAIALHVMFNHFLLPPLWTTALVLVLWPAATMVVFGLSEREVKRWLGVGMDTDMELLDLIRQGRVSGSRVGRYLQRLRKHFTGETLADLLCYVRVHAELRLFAKGMLMARELGFSLRLNEDARSRFAELGYLEKQIGETGLMALRPLLKKDVRDPWVVQRLRAST